MTITQNIITREEALAVSRDYVAYAEGNYDLWSKVNAQFQAAKRGQPALTAHKQADGSLIFIRVQISSVNHDDIRAVDGPVVRVSNGEYSWRVDGDKYAFLLK